MRILVADDLPSIRMLARATLPGHEILEAGAGDEVLGLIRAFRPDLVIIDVNMPGLNGLQVCEQIRRDPALTSIHVVVVTANHEEDARRAFDAGADHFLWKPFSPRRLSTLVQAYASRESNEAVPERPV